MPKRGPSGAALLALLWLAAPAIARPAAAAERPLEVMHSWISGSERAAIDIVRAEFERRGGRWIDSALADEYAVHRVLADRLMTDTAPTAVKWHGGTELAEMASIGLVDDYDALLERHHWDRVLPLAIRDKIAFDGHYVMVPIGVHSENWIYYNVRLLKAQGIDPPASFGDLLAAAARLEAAGVTPFALGRSDWEPRIIFVSVLLSRLGRRDFDRLFDARDLTVLDEPAARDAAATFLRLAAYLRPQSERAATWAAAAADVGAGRAGFIFEGDWAKAELQVLGLKLGEDFGCLQVPGTEKLLSIAVDTFVFPRSIGIDMTHERDLFVETILDPGVQLAFNRLKGSVPVRDDIADSGLDACAATVHRLLRTPGSTVGDPALSLPIAVVADFEALVGRMSRDPGLSPDIVLGDLKTLLGGDRSRLAR